MTTVSLLFLDRPINKIFQLCISVLDGAWSFGMGVGGVGVLPCSHRSSPGRAGAGKSVFNL